MEYFEGVFTSVVDVSSLWYVIGSIENIKLFYIVLREERDFKLRKIEGEVDVLDVASIGKQLSYMWQKNFTLDW